MTNVLKSAADTYLERVSPEEQDLPMTEVHGQEDLGGVRPLKVKNRRKLPTGVASNVKQNVFIVRDRSGSMHGHKIEELNLGCHDLVSELAGPTNRNGFWVGVIDFNEIAELVMKMSPATEVTIPDAVASGSTSFDAPMELVVKELKALANRPNPEGWHYLRPQVLFFSDGCGNASDRNIAELHEHADVTAVAYGADADEATLSQIASNGEVHVVGTDGGALRKFLAQVGQTLTDGKSLHG